MYDSLCGKSLRCAAVMALLVWACTPAVPPIKNMAVVVSGGSKLADLSLVELVKYCKGTAKVWPDGKNFVIVLKNPDAPDMRVALQKLFGSGGSDVKVVTGHLHLCIVSW